MTGRNRSIFFQITTVFKPQRGFHASDNRWMKNEFKIISTFLILNATIISAVVLLSIKGGMKFDRIIAYLFN